MIKHSLRIGNKVKVFGKIYTIKELGEFEAAMEETQGVFVYSDVQGVELTGEVLEACGFVNTGAHDGGKESWRREDFEFGVDDGCLYFYDDNDCVHFGDVSYLHKLQNAFYFLSGGTELTINLEQVKV